MQSPKNILLTGKPGVGKTTALMSAVKLLGGASGGFYTEEVRDQGERIGFRIVTLSGRSRMMAVKDMDSRCRVGAYGVDMYAIDKLAVVAIDEALASKDLIVIDEIGKMELFSDHFKEAVGRALDSTRPVIGVIMEHSQPFADAVKARADTEIIEVNKENRNRIPELLKSKVERLLAKK